MLIDRDLQPLRSSRSLRKRRSKGIKIIIGALVAVFIGVTLLLMSSGSGPQLEARESPIEESVAEIVAQSPPRIPTPPEPVEEVFKAKVPAGATMTSLLGDYFNAREIYQLNRSSRDIFPLTKIVAGNPYRIATRDGQFDHFVYEIDAEEQLIISRKEDDISIQRQAIEYDVVLEQVQGRIESSLFEAVAHLEEGEKLAFILADIFGWDINFILDLRVGDTFKVLVEKRYRDGIFSGYGKVIAAQFVNQGQVFNAIRFKDGNQRIGFYDEKGENLRKAFLKAPLSFRRISSGYNLQRKHPILGYRRSHPAIDYAAATGTPIKAIGDATIITKGYNKNNGNYLKLRHSNGYRSVYLHMNGFARGIRQGQRVTQGEVIGYVGSTGMSTGPHLHFGMSRYGQAINPLKLKNPSAKSVSKGNREAFAAVAKPLLARLTTEPVNARMAQLDDSLKQSAVDLTE
jgi:murein DD-endopeptidase MepM/ murein hydrolase activator NlpD